LTTLLYSASATSVTCFSVHEILQWGPHASIPGERCAGLARRRSCREHSLSPNLGRTASPIWPDLIHDRHSRPEAFIEQKPLMLSKLGETIDTILSSADAHATEKRRDPARVLRVPNTPGTASPSGPLGNAPADDRFCFVTLVERCIHLPLISAPTDGVDGPVRRPYFGGWQLTLQPADHLIGFDRIGAVAFKTLEHARTFAAGRQRQNQAGRRNRTLAF
jgi:hypothetical protein